MQDSHSTSPARGLLARLPNLAAVSTALAPALERAVVAGLAGLPGAVVAALAGRPIVVDGQRLDPHSQLGLRLDRLSGRPAFETLGVDAARAAFTRLSATLAPAEPVPCAVISERTIPGPDGAPPLRVRRYLPGPRTAAPAPALVFYHGGGHVLGDLDTHDALCRLLAHRAGVQVVAVDYRRAPEAPFPAAFDDALAALRWVRDAGPAEGFDPARVAVGGDSAGANLAAAVAVATAAAGEPGPAFQLLFYPLVDAVTAHPDAPDRPASYRLFATGFGLDAATVTWFRSHYLGADAVGPESAAGDVRISPLRAADLARVAPAWLGAAGFDVLRDDSAAYAGRLRAAGVAVEHRLFTGLLHGFASLFGPIPAARAAVEEGADALAAALR